MRVGAIDVGTNSVHLLVADVTPDGSVEVVETGRQQVELGTGGLGSEQIAEDAFARGLDALASFHDACTSLGCIDIHAAATSAVREAENGVEFCKEVKRRTGIHVRIIDGNEEARLIWLGARRHIDFSRGRVLLFDLGGGSTEFILADAESALITESLPVGHIRLTEDLSPSDPPNSADIERIAARVRTRLTPLATRVHPDDFSRLVGTSGTVRCLARMARMARGDAAPLHGDGLVLRRPELDKLLRQFQKRKANKLRELPGMDPRRERTLPAGAVVVREVMDLFEKSVVLTSDHSLRDGLLADWVLRNRPELAMSRTVPDPRRRSVLRVMERFDVDKGHAELTARLALQIFDATAPLHLLRVDDRRLLEFACLLHDVGHHIDGEDHHKHGEYLIRHTRMSGFTAPEIDLIATLVRFHRGKRPKFQAPPLAALSDDDRRRLSVLAGILRVADGLDRGHNDNTAVLSVTLEPGRLILDVRTHGAGHLERWSTVRRAKMLGDALEVELEVRVRSLSPA